MIYFLCLIVQFGAMLLRGWALYLLWSWFMAPLGVPNIGIAHALGLSVLIGLFTTNIASLKAGSAADKEKTSEERAIETAIYACLIPLFGLLFGWIFHGFM